MEEERRMHFAGAREGCGERRDGELQGRPGGMLS